MADVRDLVPAVVIPEIAVAAEQLVVVVEETPTVAAKFSTAANVLRSSSSASSSTTPPTAPIQRQHTMRTRLQDDIRQAKQYKDGIVLYNPKR